MIRKRLPTADATHSGVLTTGTQTIAGAKTFSSTVTSTVGSGSNAIAFSTDGARLQLGATSGAYFYVDGAGKVHCATAMQNDYNFETAGSLYIDNGVLTTSGSDTPLNVTGNASDGGSAVGVILNNNVALSTSGAKLLSVRNHNTEKMYVSKDGSLSIPQGQALNLDGTVNNDYGISQNGTQLSLRHGGATVLAFNGGTATAILNGGYTLAFGSAGDSSGSPGDATLNTTSGLSAFAAASTCVITNSNVDANTKVFAMLMDVDGTKHICAVTPTSGSFTVTASAAMTSGKKFYWFIVK